MLNPILSFFDSNLKIWVAQNDQNPVLINTRTLQNSLKSETLVHFNFFTLRSLNYKSSEKLRNFITPLPNLLRDHKFVTSVLINDNLKCQKCFSSTILVHKN